MRHLIASLVVAGFTGPLWAQDYPAELMQADRAFSQYAKDHGIAEAFAQYMDRVDGRLLRGPGEPVTGAEAIYENFAGYAPALILHWEPSEAFASQAGDFGMTWGWYYVYREGDMSRPADDRGKYVTVWRRNSDGEWRGLLDMGTRDGSYQRPDSSQPPAADD